MHGEQEIVIHRPTPVEGRIASRNRIVDVVDKGPSRGALLYYEKSISDGDSGEVYATCNSTMFFRADGGFGGPPRPVRPVAAMPDTAPDLTVDLETRPEQALYYRLNGDENPLHSDPASAVRAGFERPILHGLCTFGLCAHAVLRSVADYDPVRLRRFALRFSAPVFPGETIRVFVWRSGSFQAQVLGRGDMVARNGSFELAA